MSDVYRPPQSDVLGSLEGPSQSFENNGVYPISAIPVLQTAWARMQPHLGTLVVAGIGLFLVNIVISMPFSVANGALTVAAESVDPDLKPVMLGLSVLASVVGALVGQVGGAYVALGMARGSLRVIREDAVEIGDFFIREPRLILHAVGAQLLMGLAIGFGFLFFIVPGVLASLGLWIWATVMVAEGLGPVDSLRRSWQLTNGAKGGLFVYSLVLGVGGSLFAIATCFLGSLVLFPLAGIGSALIYEGLQANRPAFEG